MESQTEYKNGFRILCYQAGSVYSKDITQTRDNYDTSEALLSHSLLTEFLERNGLKSYKFEKGWNIDEKGKYTRNSDKDKWNETPDGEWTRDIICVKFDYGVRSFDAEIASYKNQKAAKKRWHDRKLEELEDRKNDEISEEEFEKRKAKLEKDYNSANQYLEYLEKRANENISKFKDTIQKESLRIQYYLEGLSIKYPDKAKAIKYRFLYRSVGKAKAGSAIFINEKLFNIANDFIRMGKKQFDKEEEKVVEIAAYQSLVASSIVGKVNINPENILIINDVKDETPLTRKTISIQNLMKDLDLNGVKGDRSDLQSSEYQKKMHNELWDGQALIDCDVANSTYFLSEDDRKRGVNGFILLRQHFFKAAAFSTDLKQFFNDYCDEKGLDYYTYKVTDCFGIEHNVKDIQLITTNNACKWMKYGKGIADYQYWCSKVNDCYEEFGVVKTAHESKFGDYQRQSYQMLNILDNAPEVLSEVTGASTEYFEKLNNPPDLFFKMEGSKIEDYEFLKFLNGKKSFMNDYEMMIELAKYNKNFLRTSYFRDRKADILYEYRQELKSGRLVQKAENLIIVGNPYAMLLAAAGEKPESLRTFDSMFIDENIDNGPIQCYTEQFENGEELACFRSPFNSRNNLAYLKNRYPDEKIRKYFRFGKEIIAVNLIGNMFQQTCNGSDQDSDFIYTTVSSILVRCAKQYSSEYATIINDIPQKEDDIDLYKEEFDGYCTKEKITKTKKNFFEYLKARKDNDLAAAKGEIGDCSNDAQLALTYSQSFPDDKQKYEDFVCILSVLAQAAIDGCKRPYEIDSASVRKDIESKMCIEELGHPFWWKIIEDRRSDKYSIPKKKEKIEIEKEKSKRLHCIMNSIYAGEFELKDGRKDPTKLPELRMEDFTHSYVDKDYNSNRRIIKKMENKIIEYINKVSDFNSTNEEDDEEKENSIELLRSDFKNIIKELRSTKIDSRVLTWYLIDRTFGISVRQKVEKNKKEKAKKAAAGEKEDEIFKRELQANKPVVLKLLYETDKRAFFDCIKTESETCINLEK